jgi:replication-associated recombination protein RarA
MQDDDIRLLMQSFGAQILGQHLAATGAVSVLLTETLRFRDQLLADTGVRLTVGDTREALNALELYLDTRKLPDNLTSEQAALAQLYVDRLTLFKRS